MWNSIATISNQETNSEPVIYSSVTFEIISKIKVGSVSRLVQTGWKQYNVTEKGLVKLKNETWEDQENKIREELLDFYWKSEDQRLNREYKVLAQARKNSQVFINAIRK